MEEIDSSDSDATVNYGAEPPETAQESQISSNSSQSSTIPSNDVVTAAEPVERQAQVSPVQIISTLSTELSTQDEVVQKPTPKKGRKRKKNCIESDSENDEDGMTCPICLDNWELSGSHRPASLRCGHIFGESCIRRWLRECPSGSKVCPQCKARAFPREIRNLYIRKLCVLDNSEAVELRKCLEEEKQKVTALQMDLQMSRMENKVQSNLILSLQQQISVAQMTASTSALRSTSRSGLYKLFMEKNVEICKDPGCRVLLFGSRNRVLLASQKSTTSIFPGYGLRFVDLPTFKPNQFMSVSTNGIKDICFDHEEGLLAAATGENTCKVYDINTKCSVLSFTPSTSSTVWSCGFDRTRTKYMYLGSQNGSIFVYDIAHPRAWIKEFKTPGDFAPVVKVISVPPSDTLPFGGFLVCKLVSCWFFEFTNTEDVISTKLSVEGPFISMSFDYQTKLVLLSTRPSQNHPLGRHILGEIVKLNDNLCSLQPIHTFHGSKVQSQITRSCQITMKNNNIVAAYMEDTKILQTWEANRGSRMHAVPVQEKILDTCPIYLDNDIHLAALTDNKLRVYKFNQDV